MEKRVEHFTDLKVWQRAHELFVGLAKDLESAPRSQVGKVVTQQILRSSSSIGANISEGFGADSGKEYLRYLDIAYRTTNETENWLLNIHALQLIPDDRVKRHTDACSEIRRMLSGLRRSIRNRLRKPTDT